jgi:uncharacterized protein (DUF488 family)
VKLFTLGYGNHNIDTVLELLVEQEITRLVDVRSRPTSRQIEFSRNQLQGLLSGRGIDYSFLGDKLGGIPDDPEIRREWKQGELSNRVVSHLRSTAKWQAGLAEVHRLLTVGDGGVCILCSESNPDECHRKAIALDLVARIPNLKLTHLRVGARAPTELGLQQTLL